MALALSVQRSPTTMFCTAISRPLMMESDLRTTPTTQRSRRVRGRASRRGSRRRGGAPNPTR
jgi:hypothetical protein